MAHQDNAQANKYLLQRKNDGLLELLRTQKDKTASRLKRGANKSKNANSKDCSTWQCTIPVAILDFFFFFSSL